MPYAPVLNPYPAQAISQGFSTLSQSLMEQQRRQQQQQQFDAQMGEAQARRALEEYALGLRGKVDIVQPPGFPGWVTMNRGTGQTTVTPVEQASAEPDIGSDPTGTGNYYWTGSSLAQKRPETKSGTGKQLTAEQAKRLSDLLAVRDALPKVREAYGKIADNNTTGPIAGRIVGRGNPLVSGDPDIQQMEAVIDSLTPALARGVFGEVGVLTDADVARYRALLPGRMHDADVAEKLYDSLAGRIDDTISSVLDANRDAGYDVSGFEKSRQAKTQRWRQEAPKEKTSAGIPGLPSLPQGAGQGVNPGALIPAGGGASGVAPGLSPLDQQALDWALLNPDDPRAAKIKQRLGFK